MRLTAIFLVLALIVVACGGSGDDASGKAVVKKKDPGAKPAAEKQDAPSAAMIEAGGTIFKTYCIVCHGADGKLGLNGAKDMTVSTLSKEEMISQVTKGKGAMAAYESILKADEIEAVVEYVRTEIRKSE